MKSITVLLFSLAISLTAQAQTKNEIQRKGLVFGFSTGIANSNLNFPTKN